MKRFDQQVISPAYKMKKFKVIIIITLLLAVGSGCTVFHHSDPTALDQKEKLKHETDISDFALSRTNLIIKTKQF